MSVTEEQGDSDGTENDEASSSEERGIIKSLWNRLLALPTYIRWMIPLLLLLGWWAFKPSDRKLLSNEKQIIAIDTSWYPLQLKNKGQQLTAFCEVLLETIAEHQKLNIVVTETTTSRLMRNFENGQYDGVLSSASTESFPEGRYVISDIIYHLGPVLVVKEDASATSLAELKGQLVGVVGNSSLISGLEGDYDTIFTTYNRAAVALGDLASFKIGALVIDALLANQYLKRYYVGQFKVSAPLTKEGIRLILNRDSNSESFIMLFNERLATLKEDGGYAALLEDWGLVNTAPPTSSPSAVEEN